jgi:hypothetical protein
MNMTADTQEMLDVIAEIEAYLVQVRREDLLPKQRRQYERIGAKVQKVKAAVLAHTTMH